MADTVLIGCKLQHGLTITDPTNPKNSVTLRGLKDTYLRDAKGDLHSADATYATTEVDSTLWATWSAAYMDYVPLKTGAIFVARNETEARAKAKDSAPTGFEGKNPATFGVKPVKG